MKSLIKFIDNLITGNMDKKHDEIIQSNLKELYAYEPTGSVKIEANQLEEGGIL